MASPICLSWLLQVMRLAASRTFCTAGTRRAIRMAMMAMTTSNSMSVKPGRRRRGPKFLIMIGLQKMKESESRKLDFNTAPNARADLAAERGLGVESRGQRFLAGAVFHGRLQPIKSGHQARLILALATNIHHSARVALADGGAQGAGVEFFRDEFDLDAAHRLAVPRHPAADRLQA